MKYDTQKKMMYHLFGMSAKKFEHILIASTNRGKVIEIGMLLEDYSEIFFDLAGFPEIAEPVEDGETFSENAMIKARYYAGMTRLPVVTDDSGLMVDSLNGAPGVHSARLVEPGASDSERNIKLLSMLDDFSEPEERKARFVCAACLYDPEKEVMIIEEGILSGHIAYEPEGEEGFGFDPIFIPNGYTMTVASLGLEVKNKISHRRIAFEKLGHRIEPL